MSIYKLNTEYHTQREQDGVYRVVHTTTYVPVERFIDNLRYRHQCTQMVVEAEGYEVLDEYEGEKLTKSTTY